MSVSVLWPWALACNIDTLNFYPTPSVPLTYKDTDRHRAAVRADPVLALLVISVAVSLNNNYQSDQSEQIISMNGLLRHYLNLAYCQPNTYNYLISFCTNEVGLC